MLSLHSNGFGLAVMIGDWHRATLSAPWVSILLLRDALDWGESFDPGEHPVVPHITSVAANSHCFTADQVADLLSVVLWADMLVIDEAETSDSPARLGLLLARLESLLVSLRPVASARAELTLLEGSLLLDGFEVWAARQRSVIRQLAASSPGSS